jgi:hypothetical protein
MTVDELIETLKTFPGDIPVTTWDPYHDRETRDVHVSYVNWGETSVIITNTSFNR